MLENIHIQNFRCFEDFKMEGFERVNLIGGKNNSGKTCFLEAIQFSNCIEGKNYKLEDLANGRKSKNDLNQDKESITNFFFNKQSNRSIEVLTNREFYAKLDPKYGLNIKLFSKKRSIPGDVPYRDYDKILINSKIIFDKFNQIPESKDLSIEFGIADRAGRSELIINILKLIDPNIEELKTYSDVSVLYLKVKGNKVPLPINYFGDAIQKLTRYLLAFSDFNKSNEFNYLLIDEIENGLHYTAHEEFWQHIFKLSKELNVQVFATTHSLEMIKAFNAVAKEQGEGAYFEMSREYETQNIFAFKHDTDLLTYELSKEDTTIRG